MKKTTLLLATILFSCMFVSAQTEKELILEKGVASHAEIDEVYRRFSQAYRKIDAEAVTNLYTEDAFYLSPGSRIERGREKILENFSGFFNSVKASGASLAISFRILERRVSGDLGYDVGIYTLTQKRGDQTQSSQGKFVVVARKVESGEWRFHIDSYSDLPKAENDSSISSQDLEKLLDPIFAERMQKLNIPGAVVSVVKDGKIVFTKGYGVADVDKKNPVVADKTIFRIGSISKVFTALAVMQLADAGKINLTDDINKYLKGVTVPNTFPQPVTFANLLTHTSGLDEISPGRRTSNEAEVVPLGAFLKTRIVRHLPPGEIISYSTYNSALAGHIVEQITQTPFKVYLQKSVFEPLGMNRTSITAVKDEYKQDLATGYEYSENKYQKLPFQWFHTYPASDVNSTATDMARFMIANLQGGAIDGKRILSEPLMREMHKSQFRNHPRVPGWGYGFYELEQNNLKLIEHGGSMDDGYSALIALVPEKNLGIFVAANTEGGAFGLGGTAKDAVLNRFFPMKSKPELPKTENPLPDALKRFAGKYRSIMHCHSCPAGSGAYIPETFEVKITDDVMLTAFGVRWKQIEPLLFVAAEGERAGQALLGFKENKQGEIAYMFQAAYMVAEKVSP